MNINSITTYFNKLVAWLTSLGMDNFWATVCMIVISFIILFIVSFVLDVVCRKLLIQLVKLFGDSRKKTFDDYLMESNFPRFVSHFVPLFLAWNVLPILFKKFPFVFLIIEKGLTVYLVILSVLVFRSILKTTKNLFNTKPQYQDKPLQSYVQVLMIFGWGIGIFIIVNLLTGFDFLTFSALGAASAIILLIFKDTILGFVASIQISVNDIVRIGDWITFSKFGADGYVTEINLATVKVMNFDNTFTTIPTYSLISDSFQNWRGMQESEGRRIKRSIYIKQNSIKFLTQEEVNKLSKIQLIAPYLKHREKEVTKYNKKNEANKELLINGRNQTNLGVFRSYAESFIIENELINPNLFLMVRHLAPTDKGIPIEIFCFTYDKRWENYERIQADIFDHLIAAVPYFDLEVFESPTSADIKGLRLQ